MTTSQKVHSEVPKFAAGLRYLKERLSAAGAQVLPSEQCLADFVLNAIEAAARAQEPGESYVARLRREIEGRGRFILEWTSSDQPIDRALKGGLIGLARQHGLSRAARNANASRLVESEGGRRRAQ